MNNNAPLILLADDDQDDQEMLEHAFSRIPANIKVHVVSSGTDALDYLTGCPDDKLPSLIILDFNMPDWTGAEVLQRIYRHKRYQNIPAVVWSTSNTMSYKDISKRTGAREYFQKPYDVDAFYEMATRMASFIEQPQTQS